MLVETFLGETIIREGEAFNNKIGDEQAKLLKGFKPGEAFLVAVANSLSWAGRAANDLIYFEKAVDFLGSGEEYLLNKLKEYSQRYEEESLLQSLYGWRQIISQVKVPIVDKINVKELLDFQSKCRSHAIVLHRAGKIKGVNAWFFCAPFKIIVAYRKNLWKDKAIDEMRMPVGRQVSRAVEELFKKKANWVSGYEELRDLFRQKNIEGGLSREGLILTEFVHGISKRIAYDKNIHCHIKSRRVIHVNSGLYLMGKNGYKTSK